MKRQLKGTLKSLGLVLVALLVGFLMLQGSKAQISMGGETVSTAAAAANTCYVTFDLNGGGSVNPTRKQVTVGGTYGSLPTPTRSGYKFLGWYTSKNGGSVVTSSSKVNAQMNHSIYAHWEALPPPTCKVSLNLNGGYGSDQYFGSFTRNQGSTYGGNLDRDPTPPSGKHFVGWYTSSSGGSRVYSSSTVPSQSSITLYAHYDYNTYTIYFSANGGSGSMGSKSCTYGSTYSLPSIGFSRSGYSFAGWSTSSGGSVQYGNCANVSNLTSTNGGSVTLYAQWTRLYCTVHLNLNGGNGTSQYFGDFSRGQGDSYGSNLDRDPAPPTGKHFVGWYTAVSGGSRVYSSSTVPYQSSITLYAHYDFNTYTVNFNANGGSGSMGSKTYTYGTTYALPSNGFSRTGYSFTGWSTSSGGSVQYANAANVSNLSSANGGSVTLYAQWKQLNCVVSFDVNGGNGQAYMGNKTLPQGSKFGSNLYSAPGAPNANMHFVGWFNSKSGGTQYTSDSTVPYSNSLTLYAHWDTNKYTIAFSPNASGVTGSMSSMTCQAGSAYNLTANSYALIGYTFAGWNTKSDGSGTSYANGAKIITLTTVNGATVTLYAQWNPAYCKITFDVNGGNGQANLSAQSVQQGKVIGSKLYSAPGAPQHKHFVGWFTAKSGGTQYTSSSTAPYSSTLTLYAHWEQDAYTIAFNNNATGVTGTMSPMTKCLVDSSYKLSGNTLSRKGYTFNGWNTKSDGSGKTYADGATVSNLTTTNGATVTLYAQWKVLYCNIKFDVNGGNGQANMPAQSVPQGATIGSKLYSAPGAPTHKHFVGWFDKQSGGTQCTSSSTAPYSSTLTLYAHWEQDAYTIVFNNNATGVTGTMNPMTKCLVDSSYKLTGNTLSR
ncbi:MAG: InlB B-repeat-containing protein, partial [Lachnospiraceae bacterium]|nr:InlB B-repeat-containing protein [Lachnospiraceae bacterium]